MQMLQKSKINVGQFMMTIMILSFCAVCIVPIFPLRIIRLVQMIVTIVMFFFMMFSLNISYNIRKIGIGMVGFYSMILLYWGLGYSDASIGNYFYQITFFITIAVSIYCIRKIPETIMLFIYYAVLLMISIRFFQDIIIGRTYQDYTMSQLLEMGSNVIATSFSTLSLIVFCIALLVFLYTDNKTIKVIHLILVVLNFYYIVFCGQRGSVVVLMLIAVFLMFYEKYFHKDLKNRNSFFIVTVLALVLFFIFADSILSLLIQLSPNERLAIRFEDMQKSIQSDINEDSFSGRLYLERVSIRTWLSSFSSFLFGIGDHRMDGDYGIQGYIMTGIGGHSELIDSLARYGIIGFAIIVYLYSNLCRFITSLFEDIRINNQIRVILLISVLVALTKGMFFPEIGIGMFILLPFTSVILNKSNT